jgi:hypothetical protein
MRYYVSVSAASDKPPVISVDESNGASRLSMHLTTDLYVAMDRPHAEALLLALSLAVGRATALDEDIFARDQAVL